MDDAGVTEINDGVNEDLAEPLAINYELEGDTLAGYGLTKRVLLLHLSMLCHCLLICSSYSPPHATHWRPTRKDAYSGCNTRRPDYVEHDAASTFEALYYSRTTAIAG